MTNNQRRRQQVLDAYYANPNHCRECGRVIEIPEGSKVKEVRIKRFCTRTCANRFHNRLRQRTDKPHKHGQRPQRPQRLAPTSCQVCGVIFLSLGGRRKYCDDCYSAIRFPGGVRFCDVTKGDLFARRANWQSARNSIRMHAKRVFATSGLPAKCIVCGYSLHVQISHRRSVSSFPDTATVREINELGNLVPLCPTHHWEYDHGFLHLAEAQ